MEKNQSILDENINEIESYLTTLKVENKNQLKRHNALFEEQLVNNKETHSNIIDNTKSAIDEIKEVLNSNLDENQKILHKNINEIEFYLNSLKVENKNQLKNHEELFQVQLVQNKETHSDIIDHTKNSVDEIKSALKSNLDENQKIHNDNSKAIKGHL